MTYKCKLVVVIIIQKVLLLVKKYRFIVVPIDSVFNRLAMTTVLFLNIFYDAGVWQSDIA